MHSLVLISISLAWLTTLHLCLKTFLVKWCCKRFLSRRVHFESPADHKLNNFSSNKLLTNGFHLQHETTSNGSLSRDNKTPTEAVYLSEGDVAEISQLIVGQFVSVSSAVVSIVIIWQTMDDVIHGKSWILVPFSHLFAWYFLIDLVAMLEAFSLRKNITGLSLSRRVTIFVRKKWPHVIHHVLILAVAYPIVVNYSWRGGMGDFIVGVLIAEDFSTPLVSLAKILKILKLHNTTFYNINGLILVPIFFIARVLNIPLAFLAYAAQYHNWDVWKAMASMTPVCHLFNVIQWLLQFYWFTAIFRIFVGAIQTHFSRVKVS